MTTLTDRPRTALVLVDLQNGVLAASVRRAEVLANVQQLLQRARAEDVPVVWVQHQSEEFVPETEAWQLVPELVPAEGEARIRKEHGDSFEGTELEQVLATAGAGRLVVAGAQSDACIRSTIHGAFTRGYDVTLVSDGHTTEDLTQWGAPAPESVISHTNLYWSFQSAPGRTAGIATTAEVSLS